MKYLISLVLIISSLFAVAQKVSVTLKFTQTSDYCGGAAPSEEMLERLKQPQPLGRAVFYIVKGTKNNFKPYKKVMTTEMGTVTIVLPKGTYSIFTEEQMKKFTPLQNTDQYIWDNKCLESKHKTPITIFNTNSKKGKEINIHNKCFYSKDCGKYTGPMPA